MKSGSYRQISEADCASFHDNSCMRLRCCFVEMLRVRYLAAVLFARSIASYSSVGTWFCYSAGIVYSVYPEVDHSLPSSPMKKPTHLSGREIKDKT